MYFNPELASWTLAANAALCLGMFLAQYTIDTLPKRHSIIDGSDGQKFLYLQDFWSMTVGDLVGLFLIQITFVHMIHLGDVPPWQWCVWACIALVAGGLCYREYLGPDHKPDWGSTAIGTITWGGSLHCVYFGLNAAIAVATIWLGIEHTMDAKWWLISLNGGGTWILCMARDGWVGHLVRFRPQTA